MIYDGMKVTSITRMLLLFADANITTLLKEKPEMVLLESFPLGIIVNEMCTVMTNIRSRSYINICHVDACLAVIRCLGKEIGSKYFISVIHCIIFLHFFCGFNGLVVGLLILRSRGRELESYQRKDSAVTF